MNGLRGTGSFSFETKDLFVPASRSYVEARTPNESGPLYLIPRGLFFGSGFGSVALGVARSSLDLAKEAALRKTPQEQTLLRDQPAVQSDIGRAEALWGAASAYLWEKATTLWRCAVDHGFITMEERANLRLASTHAIRQAVEVVDIAYGVFGATAIFETSPIQRKFQDAHAITSRSRAAWSTTRLWDSTSWVWSPGPDCFSRQRRRPCAPRLPFPEFRKIGAL